MPAYKEMSREELLQEKAALEQQFEEVKGKGLSSICPEESQAQRSWIWLWG